MTIRILYPKTCNVNLGQMASERPNICSNSGQYLPDLGEVKHSFGQLKKAFDLSEV